VKRLVFIGAVVVIPLVAGAVFLYMVSTRSSVREPVEEAPVVVEVLPPSLPVSEPEFAPAPTPVAPAPAAEPLPLLEPVVPELGVLRVESDIEGSQVFIDRQFVGTTPIVIENVALGGHQLNVSAEGFDIFSELIDVESGPLDIVVDFREVRLDLVIDVVHRHRFGACEGKLIATVDGLRYDTTNENDGFSVALENIAAFEVDYLDTNLSVQPRDGRRYNFTDPNDDADRLFVFHRTVDEVRARLALGDPSPAP
jgi:hypothetical protein